MMRSAAIFVVGRIGFGTMWLTGPGAFGGPRDRRAMIATLRRAIALGVTLLEEQATRCGLN